MTVGEYSPYHIAKPCLFNCYGKEPSPWNSDLKAAGVEYNSKSMLAMFDDEGYDPYGYSCFDADGEFVGVGLGVDRKGYTKDDYRQMDPEEFMMYG